MKYHRANAFTMFEMLLTVGLLVLVASFVVPTFVDEIRRSEFPESARRMRGLLSMVRAKAAFDGRRYRVRMPLTGEEDAQGTRRQPIVEYEKDPILEPEVYEPVMDGWATALTFLGDDARCAEVRLGRPTIADLQARRKTATEELDNVFRKEDFDADFPPLIVEPDGTSEWATFVITAAPPDTPRDELEDHPTIEVILDGSTGLIWLQRPFYQEELDLFEEKGWPAVLRRDFTDTRVLTENDVLELYDLGGSGS